jgi:hypothetical protein
MDERYGLLNELLQVKFANIENELALNSLFEIIPARDSGVTYSKMSFQPASFEYLKSAHINMRNSPNTYFGVVVEESKNIIKLKINSNEIKEFDKSKIKEIKREVNHAELRNKFRVIPATKFPEPIYDEQSLETKSRQVLKKLGFNPETRTDLKEGIKPIIQIFGNEAFDELLSRIRWNKQEYKQFCNNKDSEGRSIHPQLTPRLLLHIPGHFRELARNYSKIEDAFTLEVLGWSLMDFAQGEVGGKTNTYWWLPRKPWFWTCIILNPNPLNLIISPELNSKINKLVKFISWGKINNAVGSWNIIRDTRLFQGMLQAWRQRLPGVQWSTEIRGFENDLNKQGRPFYPEMVNKLKNNKDFFTPVSLFKEREELNQAFNNFISIVETKYGELTSNSIEAGNRWLDSIEAGTQKTDRPTVKEILRLRKKAKNKIPIKNIDLIYIFPKTTTEKITFMTEIKAHEKLKVVIERLFSIIFELGWNDIIYDLQGMFMFRGIINKGHKILSNHGLGTAFDINAQENPGPGNPNPIGAMEPRIIALFDAFHFKWGGVFTDPHHFEYRIYSEEDIKNGRTIQAVHYP